MSCPAQTLSTSESEQLQAVLAEEQAGVVHVNPNVVVAKAGMEKLQVVQDSMVRYIGTTRQQRKQSKMSCPQNGRHPKPAEQNPHPPKRMRVSCPFFFV